MPVLCTPLTGRPAARRPRFPPTQVRDNEVKAALAAGGTYCQSFNADILREPWEMLDAHGKVRRPACPVGSSRAVRGCGRMRGPGHGALGLGSAVTWRARVM